MLIHNFINFLDSFLVLNMLRSPNNVICKVNNIHTTKQQLTKDNFRSIKKPSFQANNLVVLLSFYVTTLVRCFINSIFLSVQITKRHNIKILRQFTLCRILPAVEDHLKRKQRLKSNLSGCTRLSVLIYFFCNIANYTSLCTM